MNNISNHFFLLIIATAWTFSSLQSMSARSQNNKEYEFYLQIILKRVGQGLSGDEVIQPIKKSDVNLPCRLIIENYLDLLRILLEHNLDPNIIPKSGAPNSLLHRAVAEQNVEAVKLLVSFNADVNLKEDNRTPLHVIMKEKIPTREPALQIVRYLLKKGANPNAQDSLGWTPLMHLALASKRDISLNIRLQLAKMVIEGGTDVNITAYNNKTAIESARIKKKYTLAAVMRDTALAKRQIPRDILIGDQQ